MPDVFGRYELAELLGRGGMGEVYRARDTVRGRWVALKVLPPHLASDESFAARFRRESRLAAQLNEPHIIPIHDFGEIDGRLYLDMRLVQGRDLSSVLQTDGPLAPEVAVEIVGQMASALDAAHADDLVHRDVKPSNVLLTGMRDDPGHVPFAYLVDFGIARSTGGDMTALTTTAGQAIGTLAYMSPERIYGQTGDGRGDVYALACLLFETLTGHPPFDGEPFALMFAHVNTPPPSARELRPALPPALDAVIAKGMAKAADDRYPTAGDLAAAARAAVRAGSGGGAGGTPTDSGPTVVIARAPLTPPPTPPPTPAPTPPPISSPSPAAPPPFTPLPGEVPTVHFAGREARDARGVPPAAEQPTVHLGARTDPVPAGSLPPGSTAPWAGYQPPGPPRRPRRRAFIAVTAVVVLALAAVGVVLLTRGGSTPKAGKGGKASTSDAATQLPLEAGTGATARSAIKPGGSLTYAIGSTIKNYNFYTPDGHNDDVRRVVDPLLPSPYHYDANGTPSVDTDYYTAIDTVSTDPLVVRYTINPRATWSDGTPVTYRDFAAQVDALRGTGGFHPAAVPGYDQVKSVRPGADDRQAVITFTAPYGQWQVMFAPLLPRSLTKDPDTFANAWKDGPLVTAGPFAWSRADATGYHVVRNEKWWGDRALLDSIDFRPYVSQGDAIAALGRHEAGFVNVGGSSAAANVATLRTFRGLTLRYATSTTYRMLVLNTRDPVLADVTVRRAIAQALDRAALRDAAVGSLASSAPVLQNHFLLPGQPSYADACGTLCTPDATAARSALQQDGWTLSGDVFTKGGKRLTLRILVPDDQPDAKLEATAAAKSLRMAGIDLDLSVVPEGTYAQALATGRFQLASQSFPLAAAWSRFQFSPKNTAANPGAAGSTEVNTLLRDAMDTSAVGTRNALLVRASRELWSNASYLPLYRRPQLNALTTGLVNLGSAGLGDIRWQDIGYRA